MKKVIAHRHRSDTDTFKAVPRQGLKYSYFAVEESEPVSTPSGEMVRCKLTRRAEFNDPKVDVMIYLGKLEVTWHGRSSVAQPEVFLWRDKLWVYANNKNGTPYARDGWNVLYEIQVDNESTLIEALGT